MADRSARALPLASRAEWRRLRCSFCGKNAHQVRFMSAGVAGGKICDACGFKAFAIFLLAWLTPWRKAAPQN